MTPKIGPLNLLVLAVAGYLNRSFGTCKVGDLLAFQLRVNGGSIPPLGRASDRRTSRIPE